MKVTGAPVQCLSKSVVLIGLESVGKSALFRGLTGQTVPDETNFRGSSVVARTAAVDSLELWDVPGIRVQSDSETTQLALTRLTSADVVLLVVQATNSLAQMESLFNGLDLSGRRVAIALTFADKVPVAVGHRAVYELRRIYRVPVVLVNSRSLSSGDRQRILGSITKARHLNRLATSSLRIIPEVLPRPTVFERPYIGPALALVTLLGMFALPVYLAYSFSSVVEPLVDAVLITWLKGVFDDTPTVLSTVMVGPFGLLTLGFYSFIWAFPVVLFVGIVVSFTEETGLKDRITMALDPPMRRIGLSGRDLIPIVTGFGCNVVAVVQTRACSSCDRRNCVGMIAFASACSYQIGATLSVFNAADRAWLFLPYLVTLFFVGAVYTRIFSGSESLKRNIVVPSRAFLQYPTMRSMTARVRILVHQFVFSALPVFYLICIVASIASLLGLLESLTTLAEPLIGAFGLPREATLPIVMSTIRKDGILLFDEGTTISALGAGQLFIGVYLASTLTPCLVTLWTIRKELGWRFASWIFARQFFVAVISGWVIARVVTGLAS